MGQENAGLWLLSQVVELIRLQPPEKVQAVRDDVEEVGTGVCGNTTATVVISGFLLRLAFYCFGV